MASLSSIAVRVGSLGDDPMAPGSGQHQRRLLVYLGVLMSGGGILWGVLALLLGKAAASIIPFGYVVATAINLSIFAVGKNFARARAVQVFVSLALPFAFQWVLGGFHVSGVVMLWALIALIGALTFTEPTTILKWLVAYVTLTIVSALVDGEQRPGTWLYVINVAVVSSVVVVLTTYFVQSLARARAAIVQLEHDVREARTLGQYTLLEKIGEGGMGTVYRAKHAMLRRPTAVKLVRRDVADEATLVRFEREVQFTSTLTHPNTITIYDFGRTDDGTFYYAMEYLDGGDLGAVVALTGAMPPGRAVHVLVQAARALAEAHALGFVHRDIKPANLLLTRAHEPDVVKVVDFGLVKEIASTGPDLTQNGFVSGTPSYMSPESLTLPDTLSPSADVYALGCVAYFLLTGTPVFTGRTAFEVMGHHLSTTPPSLRLQGDEPPPAELDALVQRALSKSPQARPTTRELVTELERLSRHSWAKWDANDADRWWTAHADALRAIRMSGPATAERTVLARRL